MSDFVELYYARLDPNAEVTRYEITVKMVVETSSLTPPSAGEIADNTMAKIRGGIPLNYGANLFWELIEVDADAEVASDD